MYIFLYHITYIYYNVYTFGLGASVLYTPECSIRSPQHHVAGTERVFQKHLLCFCCYSFYSYPVLFDSKQYVLHAGCPQQRPKGNLALDAIALRSVKMMSSVAFIGDTLIHHIHHPQLCE